MIQYMFQSAIWTNSSEDRVIYATGFVALSWGWVLELHHMAALRSDVAFRVATSSGTNPGAGGRNRKAGLGSRYFNQSTW